MLRRIVCVEVSITSEELREDDDGCRSKALDFRISSDEDSNDGNKEFHNATFEHGILRSIWIFIVQFEVSLKDLNVKVEKMVNDTVVNYSRNRTQVQQSLAYRRCGLYACSTTFGQMIAVWNFWRSLGECSLLEEFKRIKGDTVLFCLTKRYLNDLKIQELNILLKYWEALSFRSKKRCYGFFLSLTLFSPFV